MSDAAVDLFVSVQLRDCGPPVSRAAVSGLERSIGLELPEAYRQFLEFFNGGEFYPRFGYYFPVEFPGTEILPFLVGGIGSFLFFGLNEHWPWRDLAKLRQIHQGRVPEGTIPIADTGEDLVLLNCRRGDVVYWTRDAELSLDPEENQIPLAKSFLEFARSIQRAPRKQWLYQIFTDEEPFVSIQLHELDGLKKWVAENGPLGNLPDAGLGFLKACCDGEYFEGVVWLLHHGVDATGPLESGVKTPIQVADEAGCGDIVVLLLEQGVNPDHLFRDGHKPQRSILDFVKEWQAGERTSRRLPHF
jgi:hypothetical protein